MVSSKFSFRFYFGDFVVASILTVGLYGLTHLSEMTVIKHGVSYTPRVICSVFAAVGLLSLTFQLINACTLHVWSDRIVIKHLFFRVTVLKEEISTIELSGRKKWSADDGRSSSIIIHRKQAKRIVIPDQDYRNVPEIKSALQLYFPNSPAGQGFGATGF
jgi:hypothetical protein